MKYGSVELSLPWRAIWEYFAVFAVGVGIGDFAAPILLELLLT